MKNVYIHGLGQTPSDWEETISSLNDKDRSLYPNLVELVRDKEVSYSNLYKAFSDYCNKVKDPINLCGLSLGGVMALNYTIEHQEKVKSLVLIAAQYKMPEKMLKFQNIIFRFMPQSMFRQMGFEKADFINLCKSMMKLDFSTSLKNISCPVLVIYGEKDKANKKAATELADNIKNARMHMVKGAGHEVNIDAPDKLAELLGNFYESL